VADNNNNNVGGARKLWRFNLQADGSMEGGSRKLVDNWKTTRGPDGVKLVVEGRRRRAARCSKFPADYAVIA
jgi:gluconolactonase